MKNRWLAGGLVCIVFCCGAMAVAQEGGKKMGSAKPGKRNRNAVEQQAGEIAPGGPAPNAGFDLAAFSQQMFQQFDADGNGGLDQEELQNCLTELHQQVEQQNLAIANAARQQAFMELGSAGGAGGPGFAGLGGNGGNGGGFGSSDSQANGDQQQSSAFAEFSASSVNGQGQVQGRQGATGGGRSGGGGNFGGGAQGSRTGGGGGGRGGR